MGSDPPAAAGNRSSARSSASGRTPTSVRHSWSASGPSRIETDAVADAIADAGRAVETLSIREAGGTTAAVEEGVELAGALWDEIKELERVECDASELRFGVECGGSDATSGIAANPAVGAACDRLVEDGGTATFSETPEFIGAEHILADRCADESVRERLLDRVELREGAAELMGVDLRGAQPTPGNQEGGLTTIEGEEPRRDIEGRDDDHQRHRRLRRGTTRRGGLVLMDTPGYDVESVVGKVAGGCQVVAFTTGRGSTTGNPLAPVIKVTGNPKTAERLANNMDVDASTVIEGESLDSVGSAFTRRSCRSPAASGPPPKCVAFEEFAINELQPNELEQLRGSMKGKCWATSPCTWPPRTTSSRPSTT